MSVSIGAHSQEALFRMALSIVMSLARWSLALAGVLAAGAPACRSLPGEYQPFFKLHFKEQPAELRKMPIERQLDFYIARVTLLHPPRIDLGLDIGEQGPVVLPALFDRLRRERHGYIQASLVWVMVGMPCTPDVRPQVVAALDSMRVHLSAIEDSAHRSSAKRSLGHAERHCRDEAAPPEP
jgi:hypothetical protein